MKVVIEGVVCITLTYKGCKRRLSSRNVGLKKGSTYKCGSDHELLTIMALCLFLGFLYLGTPRDIIWACMATLASLLAQVLFEHSCAKSTWWREGSLGLPALLGIPIGASEPAAFQKIETARRNHEEGYSQKWHEESFMTLPRLLEHLLDILYDPYWLTSISTLIYEVEKKLIDSSERKTRDQTCGHLGAS